MKLIIEESKNGLSIPCIEENNTLFYLHSSYNPIREGERIFDSLLKKEFNHDKKPLIIVIGAAFVYHLHAIEKKGYPILLLEDKDTTRLLKKYNQRKSTNFKCYDITNEEELKDFSLHLLSIVQSQKEKFIPYFFTLPGYEKYKNQYCNKVIAILKDKIAKLLQELNTHSNYQKKWAYNFKQNTNNILANSCCYHINYPNWQNKNVIILAAGPSLDKNIEKIKAKQKESIIFTTDTALQTVCANKIKADGVITIDCQHYSINHYRYIDKNYIPPLLFKDIFASAALDKFFSIINIIMPPHAALCKAIHKHFPLFPFYDTGGNVTYSAISVALLCGATNITIYGADYSSVVTSPKFFYQPYCKETSYYTQSLHKQYRLDGIENQTITRALNEFSMLNLKHYKEDMENTFAPLKSDNQYQLHLPLKNKGETNYKLEDILAILKSVDITKDSFEF